MCVKVHTPDVHFIIESEIFIVADNITVIRRKEVNE